MLGLCLALARATSVKVSRGTVLGFGLGIRSGDIAHSIDSIACRCRFGGSSGDISNRGVLLGGIAFLRCLLGGSLLGGQASTALGKRLLASRGLGLLGRRIGVVIIVVNATWAR